MDTLLAQINMTWYLLPLAAIISLVYNTSRYEDTRRILRQAGKTFTMILFFMAIILGVLVALSYNL
ncbi:MAG: hypothetical protein KF861_20020 [Planctomycetaceae bacterium]|nr:hypothetical protein [Planctomycetaceae bacterium]